MDEQQISEKKLESTAILISVGITFVVNLIVGLILLYLTVFLTHHRENLLFGRLISIFALIIITFFVTVVYNEILFHKLQKKVDDNFSIALLSTVTCIFLNGIIDILGMFLIVQLSNLTGWGTL